ncbi:MAG: hypothetical protein KJ574_02020 [Nanoarchaeota archaeon]|nr:hypothetical protein [Nanoarchaeota archaeon]
MEIAMRMTPKRVDRTYGTLGSIVSNMYKFIESRYDEGLLLHDSMNSEDVRARDYFQGDERRYIVLSRCLPLDIDVKGAYIPKKGNGNNRPVVETSAVDMKALEERLKEGFDGKVLLDKNIVRSRDGCDLVRIYTAPVTFRGRRTQRSGVSAIPVPAHRENTDLAIKVFDVMYEENTFEDDPQLEREMSEITGAQPVHRLELRQELQLKQVIELEQQLALKQKLQMSPMMIQSVTLLQKSTQELIDMVDQANEEIMEAQRAAAYVIRKRAIAAIKNAVPGANLSWKQATTIFHRMVRKTG